MRRLGEFILPNGQDQLLASPSVRKLYEDPKNGIFRHVHRKPLREDPSTWLVQGRDTVNHAGWDHRKGSSPKRHDGTIPLFEDGHFETVLLLHNPSPERREKETARLLSELNARMSGGRS